MRRGRQFILSYSFYSSPPTFLIRRKTEMRKELLVLPNYRYSCVKMYVRTRCDDASPIHTCRLPPPRTALRSAIVRCNACALRRGGIRERCRAGSGCTFTHTRVGNPPHTTCGPSSASLSAVARSHGNVHSGAHVESERTLSHLYEFELQLAPFCVEDGATAHARCQHGVRTRHRVTGRRPPMRATHARRGQIRWRNACTARANPMAHLTTFALVDSCPCCMLS